MKLLGKRVERGNAHGNSLCMTIQETGHIKLSPALVSALGIKAGVVGANKIGFAYSEAGEAVQCCVYASIDGDGVSVNKQGRLFNMPHNRDIRNLLGFPLTEEHVIMVDPEPITDAFEGYQLFELDNNSANDDDDRGYKLVEREVTAEATKDDAQQFVAGTDEELEKEVNASTPEFKTQPVVDGIAQDDEEEELDMF